MKAPPSRRAHSREQAPEGEGPRAERRGRKRAALIAPPRPLLHPGYGFVMMFSPKSACSSAVIWFFHTLGLYDEARAYDEWPHNYRTKVYYRRPEIVAAFTRTRLHKLRLLKIVRDPMERAASSFRHALNTGYADNEIKAALGIDVAAAGLSFEQFVDFLETENLQTCNVHHRVQRHPLEQFREPDFLINVTRQNLFERLGEFEATNGMPITDFRQLSWIHELQSHRTPSYTGDAADAYKAVLTRMQAGAGPWPRHLISEEARQRLRRLYAVDVQLYGECGPA